MVDSGTIASIGQAPIQSPAEECGVPGQQGVGWGIAERGLCVKSKFLLTAPQPLQ